jgi:hypothetical protein
MGIDMAYLTKCNACSLPLTNPLYFLFWDVFSIFGGYKSLLATGGARLYFFRGKLKEGTME